MIRIKKFKLILGYSLNLLKKRLPLILLLVLYFASNGWALQLYVGAASVDITPPLPVALAGQMHLRVADSIETPVTANILALESRGGNGIEETTIWVSVDLVMVAEELKTMVRNKVKKAVPAIDTTKIIISATHTHTAPLTRRNKYNVPDNATTVDETLAFISNKIANGVQQAWEARGPGSMSWGLGYAAMAINRRATYYDGSAQMYGETDLPEFRGLEGPSPNDVNVLFFWDEEGNLVATSVDVPCPAQVVESRNAVNADYWHPVRERLKNQFGEQLVVLGWIGAAGDQSPHPMYQDAAEQRMRQLQGIDRLHQLGYRLAKAVEEVYEVVKTDKHSDVQFQHEVRALQLPKKQISFEVFNNAKKAAEEIKSDNEKSVTQYKWLKWHQEIMDRYEEQSKNPRGYMTRTIHVVRLGDVAICSTSQFELYTEFGVRIKARSKALQTFIIQLAGPATYLPTMKAVRGGGFSATPYTNDASTEAGQILVDNTVELINEMWPEEE